MIKSFKISCFWEIAVLHFEILFEKAVFLQNSDKKDILDSRIRVLKALMLSRMSLILVWEVKNRHYPTTSCLRYEIINI